MRIAGPLLTIFFTPAVVLSARSSSCPSAPTTDTDSQADHDLLASCKEALKTAASQVEVLLDAFACCSRRAQAKPSRTNMQQEEDEAPVAIDRFRRPQVCGYRHCRREVPYLAEGGLARKNCGRCSQCKLVFYCSAECQARDWSIHKIECNPLSGEARLLIESVPEEERAALPAKLINADAASPVDRQR